MVHDMTTGYTPKILIKFALPMILSGIFQQLYNMVDSIVVGRFDGVNALAAVGASFPITMLFIAVATGSGVGCAVVVSQIFGAKKLDEMKTAISTAIISVVCLALVSIVLGTLFCNTLISLLGTPAEIFDSSAAYLQIYTYGVLFLFLYNISTAIFNGLGDSKTPLYFLMFSSVLNIILDVIFVRDLHLSVVGVGWATVIAQGTASVLSFALLIYRIRRIPTEQPIRYFDCAILKRMVNTAAPSILQMSTVAVGQLLVQALVNSYGAVVIAGYSAAIKIDAFFKVALQTMASAISSFSAQNYGAQEFQRIDDGYKSALKIMVAYGLAAFGIVLLFGPSLIGLFDDGNLGDSMIVVGVEYMKIVSVFYPLFAVMMVGNGTMRGMGQMRQFTTSTLLDLSTRVVFSYVLAYFFGYQAIWWAIPAGWLMGAVVINTFYKRCNIKGLAQATQAERQALK